MTTIETTHLGVDPFAGLHATAATPFRLTMQHAYDDELAAGRADNARKLRRLAKLAGSPLDHIPAEEGWLDAEFPRHRPGDPLPPGVGTEKSYKAYRRAWQAAIRNITGLTGARRERRGRDDDWARVVSVMARQTDGLLRDQQLSAIRSLADRARKLSVAVMALDADAVRRIDDDCLHAGRRKGAASALRLLGQFRHIVPELDAELPVGDLPDPAIMRRAYGTIPHHLLDEAGAIIDAYCEGTLDPLERNRIGDKASQTRDGYRAAIRYWLLSLMALGYDLDQVNGLAALTTPITARDVMNHWIDIEGHLGGISRYSAAKYASEVRNLVRANPDRFNTQAVDAIGQILVQTLFYQEGSRSRDHMPPEVRGFCRRLIRDKKTRRTFYRMHLELRSFAQVILDRALAEHRELTGCELTRVRKLGTMAAAIAIETAGAPLRLNNLRTLRHRGVDRTLYLPNGDRSDAVIMIPISEMKGEKGKKKELPPIPIVADRREGLQTLEWYIGKIRPLFPYHEESQFLFPAVRSAEAVGQQTFHTWILEATTEAGLTMNTHRFRHALAPLCMNRDASMVRLVAMLLGNSPATVMRNYAWLDNEQLIGTAQAQIALMFDEDAA